MPPHLSEQIIYSFSFKKGITLLENPSWPLCNLFIILYLTGPYESPEELLDDLPASIEAADINYKFPARIIRKMSHFLFPAAMLLRGDEPEETADKDKIQLLKDEIRTLKTVSGENADVFDALTAFCKQEVVSVELEEINSCLCAPCRCSICCTGPTSSANQTFFEIPLKASELSLFKLKAIDSPSSRSVTSQTELPLIEDNAPFYDSDEPVVIHWENGWSLILPRETSCPHLSESGCKIYEKRPYVCRKPQIFPFVIEEEKKRGGAMKVIRNALLAVWDCPYVKHAEDLIVSYASKNELEIFFKQNKA